MRPDKKIKDFPKVRRKVIPVGGVADVQLLESGVLLELAAKGADIQEAVKVIEESVQRC